MLSIQHKGLVSISRNILSGMIITTALFTVYYTYNISMTLPTSATVSFWKRDSLKRKADGTDSSTISYFIDNGDDSYYSVPCDSLSDTESDYDINSTAKLSFERWIVLTSINTPTDSVKYLAQLPGWRVVVVGDVKSPDNWSFTNCDFLNIARQKFLNFKVTSSLPYKSYARKNIGFLYAISHGAKFIYETDDDNRPIADLDGFIYTKETPALMFGGKHLFNPYHHFGQSTLWPRGYPLSNIGDVTSRNYWLSSDWTTPTIQQGIVNGDPDMDAIFRLTRKSVTTPINVTFDPNAPPVIVPQGVFSPFNSQNTLFHERAFWAMLIPTGTTFRMCDIWRGYWAQRLMWEVGDRLAFFPANAYQNRSPHSYLDDAKDEKDMYFQTESLISFLTNWTCTARLSFFDCVLELTTAMVDQKFWRQEEIELTRLWLEDLLDLGYTEPIRVREIATLNNNKTLPLERLHELHDYIYSEKTSLTKVIFLPAEQEWQMINKANFSKSSPQEAINSISKICPNITNRMCVFSPASFLNYYNDILVIVVFNFPGHYSNVYYLDALYNKVFPNLIFCGDNATNFLEATKSAGKNFGFIEASLEGGGVAYLCAIKAMEMNPGVKGYLILGDDIMFKHWALVNSSKDHFWVTEGGSRVNATSNKQLWQWWGGPVGKLALDRALSDLRNSSERSDFINSTKFFESLSNFTGGPDFIVISSSDLYYIPAARQRETIWYFKKFYQYRSFLEVAVPTIVAGLENKSDLVLIKGESLWGGSRKNPFRVYSKVEHFFHPMKMSDKETLQGICDMFAPDILSKDFGLICFNET